MTRTRTSRVEPTKRRIRALVADDAPRMRQMISSFLSDQNGIEVVGTAANGREVLAQAQALDPDLVVLDYQMQEMSGLEATCALRKGHPSTRIIIVTIHDSEDVRTVCLANGADGFVAKSGVYQDLPREIGRVFGEPGLEG